MRHTALALPLLLMTTAAAPTPVPTPSTGTVLRLWPGRAPRATDDTAAQTPTLTCFPPAAGTTPTGTAVVVCPGGGYHFLADGHEGTDVARWLAARGVFAAVLDYRVNVPQPAPMLDGQRAVRTLRGHARDWGFDPHRVGIMGFSAGGHVATSVATHWDTGIPHADAVQGESCRPDFMLLAYPVVSMVAGITHPGSRHVLLGDRPPQQLVSLYSNDTQVTARTPPAFIVHSRPDPIVPVKNSELLADALRRHHVSVELLELPTGGHGYGLATGKPEGVWTEKCLDWMRGRGLLTPSAAK